MNGFAEDGAKSRPTVSLTLLQTPMFEASAVRGPWQANTPEEARRPRTVDKVLDVDVVALAPASLFSDIRPPARAPPISRLEAPSGASGVVDLVEEVDVTSELAAVSTSSFAAVGEVVHAVDGLALFAHPASAAPQVVALEAVADACRTTGAAFAT